MQTDALSRAHSVATHYTDWWAGRNTGPLLNIIYPSAREIDFSPVRKDWMSPLCTKGWTVWLHEHLFGQAVELVWKTGKTHYLEDIARYLEFYADHTRQAGDGYAFFHPALGPGCLSALISDFTQFNGDTIWLELPEPMEWDEIESAISRQSPGEKALTGYAAIAVECVNTIVERLAGRFIFSIPDLGGTMDILSSLRQGTNLLMDAIDEPERIARVIPGIDGLYRRYYDLFWSKIKGINEGLCTGVMRVLADRPTHIAICDFSAMVGPNMFEEFCLPSIKQSTEEFDGCVLYHMDGPGQMPHLEHLLSLPKLHAIQWVQGAGNPNGFDPRWDSLYTRIIDAGKKICFGGGTNDASLIRTFFKRFPKEHFYIPFTARDESHAMELIQAAE